MTCIVGLKTKDSLYIGADNAGCSMMHKSFRGDKKVFKKDGMLIGFTSSYRMGNLLQYKLSLPGFIEGKETDEYMCSDFIEAVRSLFISSGFAEKENNVELGGTFIVGFKGNLYVIGDDFQIAKPADDYCSCGSGMYYALGSLYNTKDWTDPKARITRALETAEYFNPFVRGPFEILSN